MYIYNYWYMKLIQVVRVMTLVLILGQFCNALFTELSEFQLAALPRQCLISECRGSISF